MNHPFSEKSLRKPRILLAPLDWGLGHATRCIPLVRELVKQGAEVWLAGEGAQKKLLELEFPLVPVLNLEGYRVAYSRRGGLMPVKMLLQAPRLLKTIEAEHEWLKNKVREHGFRAVISDNRYGLWHETIPSVFITHQLRIKAPFPWMENILRKKNYRLISRFQECWVPDHEEKNSLAGKLSHPGQLPGIPLRYIGPLSRFHPTGISEKKDSLLILLSGPEPQRTMFEKIIVNELKNWPHPATIVRGLPGEQSTLPGLPNVTVHNHLPANKLNELIGEAGLVIARSGYSSIMDLALLKKKMILVPTPGQTEQVYLARHLGSQNRIVYSSQRSFSLDKLVEKAASFNYAFAEPGKSGLRETISEFVASLK